MNDDDIILYARAFRGRRGLGALLSAEEQAQALNDLGDSEGAETWRKVAGVLKMLESTPHDEIDISQLR
jgi:hypothetical protein